MINVLVTGSNGQLGSCIKDLAPSYNTINFIYTDSLSLNISNLLAVNVFFETHKNIHYCVNCAAYTAVDKAEMDGHNAKEINVVGAKNLAEICVKNNTVLIHISTDFVFDGLQAKPFKETDEAKPLNVYGATKLEGEKHIIAGNLKHFILRTSWLYSEHGNNFMKTMLRLAESREVLNVVSDQIGTPTYAKDLAAVIIKIITLKSKHFGVYHYSNEGVASWYDFAKAIFEITNIKIEINPISTAMYPTPATRPYYSILDKSKIKQVFKLNIPHWRESLKSSLHIKI